MSAAVKICGYGAVFNRPFRLEGHGNIVLRPLAFDLRGDIPLLVNHSEGFPFASTDVGSLRIWQDDFGLAFEVDVVTEATDRLARDVARNRLPMASIGYLFAAPERWETIEAETAGVVYYSGIRELSLVDRGACPWAHCWLSVCGEPTVPDQLRTLAAHWRVGKQKNALAAVAARGRLQTSAPAGRVARTRIGHYKGKAEARPGPPATLIKLMASSEWLRLREISMEARLAACRPRTSLHSVSTIAAPIASERPGRELRAPGRAVKLEVSRP